MLLSGITGGNPTVQRRAMAKAITLLESTRADHRLQADELLTALLPHSGRALRLGIIRHTEGAGLNHVCERVGWRVGRFGLDQITQRVGRSWLFGLGLGF